jgi:hypothetical protein
MQSLPIIIFSFNIKKCKRYISKFIYVLEFTSDTLIKNTWAVVFVLKLKFLEPSGAVFNGMMMQGVLMQGATRC